MTPQTLGQLYRRHAPVVFRRAHKLLGSEAEAHEVVQDLFLSLHERPEQFAGQSQLTTFLYSATTHACLNRLRNERRRRHLRLQRGDELAVGSGGRPFSPEEQLAVQTALRTMPERLALVATYHFVDGLSQEETARVLGCSQRQVSNLLKKMWRWCEEHRRDASPPCPAETVAHA